MNEKPFSDAIAEDVGAGHPDALAACWRALVGPLVVYLNAQVRDEEVTEDLARQTFLGLVRSCRRIGGGAHEQRAWLYRIALRNVHDWRRSRRRQPDGPRAGASQRPTPTGPAKGRASRDEDARVRAAVADLPPEQADVIALRFLGELPVPEVADVLRKSEGAVRALQHHALRNLARWLESELVAFALIPDPRMDTSSVDEWGLGDVLRRAFTVPTDEIAARGEVAVRRAAARRGRRWKTWRTWRPTLLSPARAGAGRRTSRPV